MADSSEAGGGTKRCARCGIPKPIDEFHRSRAERDGRVAECKACKKARTAAYVRSLDPAEKRRRQDRQNEVRRLRYWGLPIAEPMPEGKKRCSKCEEVKSVEEFARRGSSWASHCKECRREARQRDSDKIKQMKRAYYLANRERLLAEEHERYVTDPEFAARKKEAALRQRQRSPEAMTAYNREWRRRNPNKVKSFKQARRARLMAAPTEKVDLEAIGNSYGWRCHLCGLPITKMKGCDRDSLSFDHILPLARGGNHVAENIAPAHFGCNSRKRHSVTAPSVLVPLPE